MKFLTFDIEDWFHILDNPETENVSSWRKFESRVEYGSSLILDLLEKHKIKATFFCLGWIAEKYPKLIKKISNGGHHLGSHSYYHQLAYKQTKTEFRNDLSKSIKLLEDITGNKINAYRAPGFSIKEQNIWAFDIISDLGIKYDSSVFPASRSHGGMSKFSEDKPCFIKTKKGNLLLELPLNTYSLFHKKLVYSGGGYFRITPRIISNYLFNKQQYVMTYFHPRDFDSKQPMVPGLSTIRKFKSYYGISGTYDKLDKILSRNDFYPICSIIEENLKTINL